MILKRVIVVLSVLLLILLVAGCKKHDWKYPKKIDFDEPIPIDELELPEGMLEIYPQHVLGGEGITIRLHAPEATHVTVTHPDPIGSGEWLTVRMEKVDDVWVLPEAILDDDGTVRYDGELDDAVRGERKIYTPFLWPAEQPYPIFITATLGGKTIEGYTTVKITGSLLDRLVYRPVDPRKPFAFGVTPVWEDHLQLLEGGATP